MEFINKVELRGIVGNIRVSTYEGTQVANFSVVTNFLYKGREGAVAETFWFNVNAWAGKNMPKDFNLIEKGMAVLVQGRLRNREYQTSAGEPRVITEVVASRVEIYHEEEKEFIS